MTTVREFYAEPRWGDLWGVTRIVNGVRTNPHRAHDIKAAPGEPVPALRAGRVVYSGNTGTTFLGYHVIIDTGRGYDYYCHLRTGTRPNQGTWVNAGDSVGLVAGWNDFHGAAWTGPHLHYGSGPDLRSVYEGTTYNATAIIRDTLRALAPAAGDVKPIPAPTPTPAPVEEEDDDMPEYKDWSKESKAALVKDLLEGMLPGSNFASRFEALADRAMRIENTVGKVVAPFETPHPDPLRAAKGEKQKADLFDRVGAVHQRGYRVELLVNQILTALQIPGGDIDVDTLAAGIVSRLPVAPGVPTAEEIATAVRAKIILPEQ